MKRVQVEDVYGESYNTVNGNTIQVGLVSFIDDTKVSCFYAECSVCSKDSELWDEKSITVTIRNIRNKVAACGCSKTPTFTQKQRETQINRVIEGSGWVFQRFEGNLTEVVKTTVVLEDPYSGKIRKSLLSNLLTKGIAPLKCTTEYTESFWEEVKHNYPEGSFIKYNFNDARKKYLLSCNGCGEEDIPVRPENLKIGRKSCACSRNHDGHYPLRNEETDYLYLIKLTKGSETFIKIGRTFNIKDRIKHIRNESGYTIEVLDTINSTHKNIYNIEKETHRLLKKERLYYRPITSFGGSVSECFKMEALNTTILKGIFND